ncbi:odorant receptor 47b isoform X3 [Drosophila virilis]|uniref:odorant receptor 47b isoform X3 n=1 Tax=Drosophila virilis TaxID=7244 RepID=UPI0038B3FB26
MMASGDFRSYLRLVRGFFGEFRSVLRQKSQPPRLALHYHRAFMVYGLLCIYPNRCLLANSTYKHCNLFALCNSSVFLLTVMLAVHESTNVIDMGDDIVWIIGITLILTKIFYIYLCANEIDEVIEDLNYYEEIFKPHNHLPLELAEHELANAEIKRWQRFCYLVESTMLISVVSFLLLFNFAIGVQPLITGTELPFHVILPFGWHHTEIHPHSHAFIYIWQYITSQYNLLSICNIDLLGIHSFLHTALNLKILCIELRKLGEGQLDNDLFHVQFCKIVQFHQHIIRTVQKVNRVFRGSFIAQMIASFCLISMSTFETMAASEDPKVAAKFILLMIITFVQLSYWCLAGTLVYSQVGFSSPICLTLFSTSLFFAVPGCGPGSVRYHGLAYQICCYSAQYPIHDQALPETARLCGQSISALHTDHLLNHTQAVLQSLGFAARIDVEFNIT